MKMAVALVTLKADEYYPKGSQFVEPFPDFIEYETENRLGVTIKLVDIAAPVVVAPATPVETEQDATIDPTNASDANTAPTAPVAAPEGKPRTRGRAK